MDRVDVIMHKCFKFDSLGTMLMNQGYDNRFIAQVMYPCQCLAKVLLVDQIARLSFNNRSLSNSDCFNAVASMTPEEMRTRYLIDQDVGHLTDEEKVVKSAYSTQDELLELCKLLYGYLSFSQMLSESRKRLWNNKFL